MALLLISCFYSKYLRHWISVLSLVMPADKEVIYFWTKLPLIAHSTLALSSCIKKLTYFFKKSSCHYREWIDRVHFLTSSSLVFILFLHLYCVSTEVYKTALQTDRKIWALTQWVCIPRWDFLLALILSTFLDWLSKTITKICTNYVCCRLLTQIRCIITWAFSYLHFPQCSMTFSFLPSPATHLEQKLSNWA